MGIFHCAHSKGLEFNAFCLDVTVDVITSRSSAICMDVSLDVNFRGPALAPAPWLRIDPPVTAVPVQLTEKCMVDLGEVFCKIKRRSEACLLCSDLSRQ